MATGSRSRSLVSKLVDRCHTWQVPTAKARSTFTDSGELEELLDAAARRWPEVRNRKALLLRLAEADADAERIERHGVAIEERRARVRAALGRLPSLIDPRSCCRIGLGAEGYPPRRWLLLDRSALARGPVLDPGDGEPCLSAITRFEMLSSATSPRAFVELEEELDTFPELRIDGETIAIARAAQRELAAGSRHRVPIPELLIAACAHQHQAAVLHLDRHHDTLASVWRSLDPPVGPDAYQGATVVPPQSSGAVSRTVWVSSQRWPPMSSRTPERSPYS